MSHIVAGNFASKTQADSAIEALRSAGIEADHICTFGINPPGQHATYPIGGDEYVSPGATGAGSSALTGAAIGGAIGLGAGIAALPIAGPVGVVGGAGIGAYVGSLAGALKTMGEDEENGLPREADAARPAGVLVAVETPLALERAFAADLLRQRGARDVEETEGTWRDGTWVDFDPTPEKHPSERHPA
jgi:hypothetical protein